MLASQPTSTRTTSPWQTDAACRRSGVDPDLFFSERLSDITAAKRICAECPVMARCLEDAIRNEEPWGVWGGQLFRNGRALMVKRRRGRPRKQPRPEDEVPVVPVPAHLRDLIRTA